MDAQVNPVEAGTDAELVYIPPEHFGRVWPMVEPHVPSIIERSRGRISLETMMQEIATRKLHVFVIWDGALIKALIGLSMGTAPTGLKIATVEFASGQDSHTWLHLMPQLEDHCRQVGCQKIEMWARKGWAKKFPEYKLTHVLMEKDL